MQYFVYFILREEFYKSEREEPLGPILEEFSFPVATHVLLDHFNDVPFLRDKWQK